MEHHHHHWLEKLQVQIVTAAGLFAMYFLAWPIVRPPHDPLSPMVFLPLGGLGSMAAFAGVFCVLVAVCAVVTIAVRPVAALLAATLAAGGASLRSEQIRRVFWARQADMAGLYTELMLEAIMLALLAALAVLIVFLVRRLMAAVRPNWMWTDPVAELTDEQRANAGDAPMDKVKLIPLDFVAAIYVYLRSLMVGASKDASREVGLRETIPVTVGRCLACVAVASLIAVLLLMALMRSADRGQIIFALVASFTVAVFVGHQLFPQPYALVIWALPMVIAVVFYAIAWAVAPAAGHVTDWAKVNMLFRALPIDWLAAGGGGALLGFWASQRVHEYRLVHHHHEQEKEQGDK